MGSGRGELARKETGARTMKHAFAALCGVLAMLGASAAQAQTVSAANPQSIAAALQSAGYRAELTRDNEGDPLIKSSSSGTDFLVVFYACTKITIAGRCSSLSVMPSRRPLH